MVQKVFFGEITLRENQRLFDLNFREKLWNIFGGGEKAVEVVDLEEHLDNYRDRPRRKTGTCARHQRSLTTALKRGRYMALLPYVSAHTR